MLVEEYLNKKMKMLQFQKILIILLPINQMIDMKMIEIKQ